MKFQVAISGKSIIMNDHQLALLMTAVQDADQITERHVGNYKGSQGYNNAYVPAIESKQPHEWLQVMVMADDFVDAIKLTMKLNPEES